MKETPKRLRVHGTEEGDPLGYGKPLDESLSVRANRAKKFVNQTIQMHKKNTKETHSSIDDFVVHSRTELLAEIEAKKAAEMAKKNPVPSTPSVVPSTNGDDEDDEFKEGGKFLCWIIVRLRRNGSSFGKCLTCIVYIFYMNILCYIYESNSNEYINELITNNP